MNSHDQPTPEVLDYVKKLKSNGTFDQFRRECLTDIDSKPSFQNLKKRVENYVNEYLADIKWNPSLKKSDLRENLRKKFNESGNLNNALNRVVDQVVNPKIESGFRPVVEKIFDMYGCIKEPEKCDKNVLHLPPPPPPPPQIVITLLETVSVKEQQINDSNLVEIKKEEEIVVPVVSTPKTEEELVKQIVKEEEEVQHDQMDSQPQINVKTEPIVQKNENDKQKLVKPIEKKIVKKKVVKKPFNSDSQTLKKDPKNEYHFDWKLDVLDEKTNTALFDELSASSVHTSDLSDFDDDSINKLANNIKNDSDYSNSDRSRRKSRLNPKYYSNEFSTKDFKRSQSRSSSSDSSTIASQF